MPVQDEKGLAAVASSALFKYVECKTTQSAASKLAKEVLEGLDDWELRLGRMCEAVKQGIDTQWR